VSCFLHHVLERPGSVSSDQQHLFLCRVCVCVQPFKPAQASRSTLLGWNRSDQKRPKAHANVAALFYFAHFLNMPMTRCLCPPPPSPPLCVLFLRSCVTKRKVFKTTRQHKARRDTKQGNINTTTRQEGRAGIIHQDKVSSQTGIAYLGHGHCMFRPWALQFCICFPEDV